ncbi:MAG: methionine adenosyltransferase [Syntrophobacteraceae bacterium]
MKKDFIFSSESVTEGHPDKLCDQVSDALVDHFLERDRYARIIAECAVSTSILFIAARFSSDAGVDIPNAARKVIARIGYDQQGFNAKTCSILTSLQELPMDELCCFDEHELSEKEIESIPARNHVTVFGFACNQTPSLMPLPIYLAHRISKRISLVRSSKVLSYLAPEAKTDMGVEYRDRLPHRIYSITITAAHIEPGAPPLEKLRKDIKEAVIDPVFEGEPIKPDRRTEIFINPEGAYPLGGPTMHSGLTGRKTGIDTYGEYSRHSGAALSGKDPLRIDRIGAYAARYAAKNVVAAGLAEECELQLTYSISRSRPVSVQVETFGTGKISDTKLAALVEKNFEFRLAGIVRQFGLRDLPSTSKGGFYRKLAAYGHMGRTDFEVPWEKVDATEKLREDPAARREQAFGTSEA